MIHLRTPAALAALLVVAAVVISSGASGASLNAASGSAPSGTAPVTRRDLVQQQTFDGTISATAVAPALTHTSGRVTWLAPEGSKVSPGDVLFRIDDVPTFVFSGATPAYRDLGPSTGSGPDVLQLQETLEAIGADPAGKVNPSGTFDAATAAAVVRWQEAQGLSPTGTIPLGAIVFEPSPLTVGLHQLTVGSSAAAGTPVTQLTIPTLAITFTLPSMLTTVLKVGESVQATLPDYSTAPAVLTSFGTGTDSSGNSVSTGTAVVTDSKPHSFPDQAPAKIAASETLATGTLVVPAQALRSSIDGTWSVQVVAADGSKSTHLVMVGASANGSVALSDDPELDGAMVAVPSTS